MLAEDASGDRLPSNELENCFRFVYSTAGFQRFRNLELGQFQVKSVDLIRTNVAKEKRRTVRSYTAPSTPSTETTL